MLYVWIIIIYMASLSLCSWLYNKLCKLDRDNEDKKNIERIYNIDKIAWIISWIPLVNLYLIYVYLKSINALYKEQRRLRKVLRESGIRDILERVKKENPDDEGANALLDFMDNKKQKTKT